MKKFIVCGASRAGKSVLSKKLAKIFCISWLIGDAFVSSMQDAFPDLGISHEGDMQNTADRFETFISYTLWHYGYEGSQGYIFDSTHLRPKNLSGIYKKNGKIPTVFLGYGQINIEEKLKHIREHDPSDDWWTAEQSDEELLAHIIQQKNYSSQLKEECHKYGLKYIDTGENFDESIEDAFDYLKGNSQ